MTVGKKLQEVMDWKGLKQPEVARLSGISRAMVSEYVRDVREPTLEALRKLAQALDVSLWTLINGEPMAIKDYELTDAERRMVGNYRTLSGKSQKLVDTTLQMLEQIEHDGQ